MLREIHAVMVACLFLNVVTAYAVMIISELLIVILHSSGIFDSKKINYRLKSHKNEKNSIICLQLYSVDDDAVFITNS